MREEVLICTIFHIFFILDVGIKTANPMKLITEVSLPGYPFRIDHHAPLLLMGSCFTEKIGRLLERSLFHTCINPFGVAYNPVSVMRGLEALLHKQAYGEGDLEHDSGLWFSFDHDTGFSAPRKDSCLAGINRVFLRAKQLLSQASVLSITWGTAWVYRHQDSGRVVCNCHRIPASRFTRSRLAPGEIVESYASFLPSLFRVNPGLTILLTVSPVRHWKEGAHGNQLSKASLLLATEALEGLFPERVFYFPSYEIVMDELRDYRFYAGDMLHTSQQSTGYIWEKFSQALISPESQQIMGELEPLLKLMEHRPRQTKGEAYRHLERQKKEKLADLRSRYPFLSWQNLNQTN